MFSIISVTLSLFEHISVTLLLQTETVIIINIELESRVLADMSNETFTKLQNRRLGICTEISKIIDVDRRLIELLLPIRARKGASITFHIRSDASQGPQIMQLIKHEAQIGYLSKVVEIYIFVGCLLCSGSFFVFVCLFVLF